MNPASNRITSAGFSYDASGNMTQDGLNTYTYDAENRIKTVNATGSTYTYNAASLRIRKDVGSTTTRYLHSGSKVIAEYVNSSPPAAPAREYIYAGSQLLSTLEGGTTKYHHADHLSVRVTTDALGAKLGEQGHYPFGESWYSINSTTKWQFTSYERDSESGLDYAIFRYDSTRLGRFQTPDPLPGTTFDPQSFNRYAYVSNDPVNRVDPLGLFDPYVWYWVFDCMFGFRKQGQTPLKENDQNRFEQNRQKAQDLLKPDTKCAQFLASKGIDVGKLDNAVQEQEAFSGKDSTLTLTEAGVFDPGDPDNQTPKAIDYHNTTSVSQHFKTFEGTRGLAEFGGPAVYWRSGRDATPGNIVHEALHNMGLSDPQLAEKLNPGCTGNPSNCVTEALNKNGCK